jgi:hypothetical protein
MEQERTQRYLVDLERTSRLRRDLSRGATRCHG